MGITERVKIGDRIKRKESLRFITGRGTYVDDILPPGALHVAFARSPYAHARIIEIQVHHALSMPGVLAAFTGEDMMRELASVKAGPKKGIKVYPLAVVKVRYVGEPVAAVVAETRYQAEDAVEALQVEYEALPPVVDPEKAMEPTSPKLFDELHSNIVFEHHFSTPDLDTVFSEADHIFSARLNSHRLTSLPMETRAYCAEYDPHTGFLTCWASTASPHALRTRLAELLGIAESKVRVIAPDIGGSFGVKAGSYQDEAVIPFIAVKLKRPVKWSETRVEHLRMAVQGRDQTHYVEAAVNDDGTIVGIRDKIIADMGCSYALDNSIISAALLVPGAYDIQHYAVDAYGVATNKTVHGSLRGVGKADAAFVIERMIDIIARNMKIDPIDLRRKNFIPPDAFPYRSVTGALYDSGNYDGCLSKLLASANYTETVKEKIHFKGQGVYRGIGVALHIEPTSSSKLYSTGGYATCRIRMEPSGTITVYSSTGNQGQGHDTCLSEIVASCLGLSIDRIHVIRGDTLLTPYGFGTGSSRSSVVLMNAALIAAEKLKWRLLKIASRYLQTPPDRLELKDEKIFIRDDPNNSIGLRDAVRIAYGAPHLLPEGAKPGLEVTGYFINPKIDYVPDDKGRFNRYSTYAYAAVLAIVDVDVETGFVKPQKYYAVHDCGNMINPQIVETQYYGGTVQGIGAAMYEEIKYDDEGQLLTPTLMEYKLPTVNETPNIHLDHLVTPSPFTPLGTKGAGETGMLGPPPVLASAIEDALSEFGVEIRSTPYTPEKILGLIQEAKKRGGIQP